MSNDFGYDAGTYYIVDRNSEKLTEEYCKNKAKLNTVICAFANRLIDDGDANLREELDIVVIGPYVTTNDIKDKASRGLGLKNQLVPMRGIILKEPEVPAFTVHWPDDNDE